MKGRSKLQSAIVVSAIAAAAPCFQAACSAGALAGNHAGVAKACDPHVMPTTYEDFKRCTYQEPGTGIWIVDGDIPILDEEALKLFYRALTTTPKRDDDDALKMGSPRVELIVHQEHGADSAWATARRCSIRYCVSMQSTGDKYQRVVDAMQKAGDAWGSAGGIRFRHEAKEDGHCAASNANVEFDVQVVSNQNYLARAFFPHYARANRNVLIDRSSFTTPSVTLEGVLRHELGHALGFRHEHTRPEAGQCFEDNSWRKLTPYDSKSVMHYPQCNGTAGWALEISRRDAEGCTALYGNSLACNSKPAENPVAGRTGELMEQ